MDELEKQLAETMRRIGTKNLNEQVNANDASEIYPLYAILRYLEGHVFRLRELYNKFEEKYPQSQTMSGYGDPKEQLKIALGIIQKVKDASAMYENQVKNFYNEYKNIALMK